jgi:hypothetical protein
MAQVQLKRVPVVKPEEIAARVTFNHAKLVSLSTTSFVMSTVRGRIARHVQIAQKTTAMILLDMFL